MGSSDQDDSLVNLFPPGWWKLWALLLLMGLGGGAILTLWILLAMHHWEPILKRLPQEEQTALNVIMFLDLCGMMTTGICQVGIPVARLLNLTSDAAQFQKAKALLSTLFGLPAGGLLLYFSFGTVVGSRLSNVEVGLMVILGFVLLVTGGTNALAAWRNRRSHQPHP